MSENERTVNEAGYPSAVGPTFLFSTTLSAHQSHSIEQAVNDGNLTRFFTMPMIGLGLTPYGVGAVGSPLIMAAPHLSAARLLAPFAPYFPAINQAGDFMSSELMNGSPGYVDFVKLLFSAPSLKPSQSIKSKKSII
jgi:hypothetical protein